MAKKIETKIMNLKEDTKHHMNYCDNRIIRMEENLAAFNEDPSRNEDNDSAE